MSSYKIKNNIISKREKKILYSNKFYNNESKVYKYNISLF